MDVFQGGLQKAHQQSMLSKHNTTNHKTRTLRVQKGRANQKLSDNSQIATCDQKFGNQAQVKN